MVLRKTTLTIIEIETTVPMPTMEFIMKRAGVDALTPSEYESIFNDLERVLPVEEFTFSSLPIENREAGPGIIDAIKWIREHINLGLRDAKDLIQNQIMNGVTTYRIRIIQKFMR